MSKCSWKNGADGLARHRVATNLRLVKRKKNAISAKCNKVKPAEKEVCRHLAYGASTRQIFLDEGLPVPLPGTWSAAQDSTAHQNRHAWILNHS